jgi:hypothetical protein
LHHQLLRPTIFITSSSDVGVERDLAIKTSQALAARHPNKPNVYDWRKELFSSGRGYQDQIPSLRHPNCWVTICVFGERLGEPIDRRLQELSSRGRLPPDIDSEQFTLDVTDTSRTPLTGSVYEYLEASRGEAEGIGHVLVYLKGPKSVRVRTSDARSRGFGNFALMGLIGRKFDPTGGQFVRAPREIQDEYWQQIEALARFHDQFLANKDCRTFETSSDLAALIEDDLKGILGFGQPTESQLFKGLSSFAPSDNRALFGRHDEISGAGDMEDLPCGGRSCRADNCGPTAVALRAPNPP